MIATQSNCPGINFGCSGYLMRAAFDADSEFKMTAARAKVNDNDADQLAMPGVAIQCGTDQREGPGTPPTSHPSQRNGVGSEVHVAEETGHDTSGPDLVLRS